VTNRLAIILGALIVGAVVIDAVINGAGATLFLLKRLLELIEWMAFWR